jgi:hypothetical protein
MVEFGGPTIQNRGIGLFNKVNFIGEVVPHEATVVAQMRTAPLWGHRFEQAYLHDGRAPTVDAAILAHDGQGAAAAHAYSTLSAAAAGVAWTKAYYGDAATQLEQLSELWKFKLQYLLKAPVPGLISIGLALLVCRLRPPRPSIRRLVRQPGAVAMACVGLMLLLNAATMFAGRALSAGLDQVWPPTRTPGVTVAVVSDELSQVFAVTEVGPVIAACWLLLAVAGRWRAERSWVDRLGRCLGVCWIVAYLASAIATYLTP